jgi:transcriptional regulator with XRE-family HTH domain
VDVEVGRRIRLRRTQLRFSQSHLGDELGVTFQQVQKYEKGANRVGASRLVKIAEVLNTSVAALTNTAGKGGDIVSELLVQPHALELLTHYSAIKERKLRLALVKLAEAIASRE